MSKNTYSELLPNKRITHSDKLVRCDNFYNKPGEATVLSYLIKFSTVDRCYAWGSVFSTDSENYSLPIGLNKE